MPYPPDYGGVIDAYYRIEALSRMGIEIYLHCFEYGREKSAELNKLCKTVTYYKRKTGLVTQLSCRPYIVSSRMSDKLVNNLKINDFPILFEGLHTTFCIQHPDLKKRIKIVRAHNIEHQYYRTLVKLEGNIFRKLYFILEAYRLEHYESVLVSADHVMCVSDKEHEYFQNKYHNSVFIPSSHPYQNVECLHGLGSFVIYHGDLSVNENDTISKFLINEVFSKIPYPCVIAGKNPSNTLRRAAEKTPNVQLIANPNQSEMKALLSDAQIHLLPVMQNNGLKLKLLLALYAGRHCLVNKSMVDGTSLEPLCHLAETPLEMIEKIHHLMSMTLTTEMIENRKHYLLENYSNEKNAEKLIELL